MDIIGAVAPKREAAEAAPEHWLTAASALLRAGHNVAAIKHTRSETGWDLLRSKRFVEALIAELFRAKGETS